MAFFVPFFVQVSIKSILPSRMQERTVWVSSLKDEPVPSIRESWSDNVVSDQAFEYYLLY